MDQITRELAVTKFGTLMMANTELAAENVRLIQLLKDRDVKIAELEKQLADGATPAHSNLPANPYAENGDARH